MITPFGGSPNCKSFMIVIMIMMMAMMIIKIPISVVELYIISQQGQI